MFKAIADGFGFLFDLLRDGLFYLLNGILKIFQPILDLIAAIFYLLHKLGVVLYKVLSLVMMLAKLLIGIITGLFNTITGLNYSGTAASLPPEYQDAIGRLDPIMGQLQLDKIAYLMLFIIWIFAGFAAMKIIGGMRGGGSS